MPRKKKNNIYFNEITENAIILYNKELNYKKKNEIYNKYIYPSLYKLADFWINYMHAYNLDDIDAIRNELIIEVTENLSRINTDLGKAFSYCSIIIRNYIITKSKKSYNNRINQIDLDYFDTDAFSDKNSYIIDDISDNNYKFIIMFTNIIKNNINILFASDKDKQIVNYIISLFNSNILGKINKREIYKYIKSNDININSKKITETINLFKILYIEAHQQYIKNGFINKKKLLAPYEQLIINNIEIFKYE